MICPQCRTAQKDARPLEPLEARYAAELGGLTCHYLYCPECRTISREVRGIERWLGTAILLGMLGISAASFAVGCYLWVALHLHGRVPMGFLMTSFALEAGAGFAVSVIWRKLRILHSHSRIIPIGELREG
jgi:hypothetical protein